LILFFAVLLYLFLVEMYSRQSLLVIFLFVFFFNAPATTEIYTLSLHDALPIYLNRGQGRFEERGLQAGVARDDQGQADGSMGVRSEEHTSELQSLAYLVCRLLLEKKKNI